jgi:hypothetical protein
MRHAPSRALARRCASWRASSPAKSHIVSPQKRNRDITLVLRSLQTAFCCPLCGDAKRAYAGLSDLPESARRCADCGRANSGRGG